MIPRACLLRRKMYSSSSYLTRRPVTRLSVDLVVCGVWCQNSTFRGDARSRLARRNERRGERERVIAAESHVRVMDDWRRGETGIQ